MRKITSFLIGSLIGGLVGATAALLLAPDSGETLRAELKQRGQMLVDEIQQAAETRRLELRAQLEAMRQPPQA